MGTKVIVTTVGTSLISNYKNKNQNEELYELGNETEKEKPISTENYEEFKKRLTRRKVFDKLKEFALEDFPDASAELKSIQKLREGYPEDNFIIYLLTSDTFEGYFIGEILKEILEDKLNADVELDYIKGLQVRDNKKLKEEGFPKLFKKLENIITSYYYKNVILNITGGYKGIASLITIIGQINEIPIYYIFEDSDVLVEIPALPLNVKWSYLIEHEKIFRGLIECIDDWNKYKEQNNIYDFNENFIEKIEENGKILACLNPIGTYLFKKFKNSVILKIYTRSEWMKKEGKNIKEIEEAFRELYFRLKNLIENNPSEEIKTTEKLVEFIKRLNDTDDLKHGGNLENSAFIFKSTNINQIRVIYSPILYKSGYLTFKVFDVLRSDFDHSTYIDEQKEKMKKLKPREEDFKEYPLRIKQEEL